MLLPVPREGPRASGPQGVEGALGFTSCCTQKTQLRMWPNHLLSRREHKRYECKLLDVDGVGLNSGSTAARAKLLNLSVTWFPRR